MSKRIEDIVDKMMRTPQDIRFSELCKVCDYYFKKSRQRGSSHRIYEVKVTGLPPINIQSVKGKAKAYQVRQVLKAITIHEGESNGEKKDFTRKRK